MIPTIHQFYESGAYYHCIQYQNGKTVIIELDENRNPIKTQIADFLTSKIIFDMAVMGFSALQESVAAVQKGLDIDSDTAAVRIQLSYYLRNMNWFAEKLCDALVTSDIIIEEDQINKYQVLGDNVPFGQDETKRQFVTMYSPFALVTDTESTYINYDKNIIRRRTFQEKFDYRELTIHQLYDIVADKTILKSGKTVYQTFIENGK